jgi:perosamine synthetase
MKTMLQPVQPPKADLRRIQSFLPDEEPALKGERIIRVCEPDLTAKETKYVVQAMNSSWISSSGTFLDRFEAAFAKEVADTKYAFAVNSGTTALHVAVASLGLQPSDEVITTTFTMVATINAITYCGATPVLVDCAADDWNMDVAQLSSKITPKTKAILVVHIYGIPVDMKPVMALAKKHKLWVIEDVAEAPGAEYDGQRVGSIGDIGAFSTYANKHVTTGEGGLITTNNGELALRLDALRRHAFSKERHFWHTMLGFGYRMTNVQAAIGLSQIERFPQILAKKKQLADWYHDSLKDLPGLQLLESFWPDAKRFSPVNWMYGIVVNEAEFGMSKNALRLFLANKGIETRSFFIPLHWQPIYFEQFRGQQFPNAERFCRDGLYVPSSTKLKKAEVQRVIKAIQQAFSSVR